MDLRLTINAHDPTPLYVQLEGAICRAIAEGRFNAGDQLPTVRRLAVALRINMNTVAKVYAGLERRGVLTTRRGVGTFVSTSSRPDKHDSESMRAQRLASLVGRFLTESMKEGFSPGEVGRAFTQLGAKRR